MTNDFKQLGQDVVIHPDSVFKVPEQTVIGHHNAIDKGFICNTVLQMGDYIHIAPYVVVIGGKNSTLILEDFSFIAAGTKVIAGSELYTEDALIGPTIPAEYRSLKLSTIRFGRFTGCGVNCAIMPGVTLGEGSVIGANAVVTRNTEPWTVYVGNPAKPVKTRPNKNILEYAKRLGYE